MPAFNATLGSSTATSYISVAQADDWYAGTLNEDAWTALDDDQKQAALVAATRALETLTYAGVRCTPSTNDPAKEQALQWPRSGATCKGITAVCGALPQAIIDATAYLALNLYSSGTIGGGPIASTGALKKNKLGDLEQEFYDVKGDLEVKVSVDAPLVLQQYPVLVDMLGCWSVTATGSAGTLYRVRS